MESDLLARMKSRRDAKERPDQSLATSKEQLRQRLESKSLGVILCGLRIRSVEECVAKREGRQ